MIYGLTGGLSGRTILRHRLHHSRSSSSPVLPAPSSVLDTSVFHCPRCQQASAYWVTSEVIVTNRHSVQQDVEIGGVLVVRSRQDALQGSAVGGHGEYRAWDRELGVAAEAMVVDDHVHRGGQGVIGGESFPLHGENIPPRE